MVPVASLLADAFGAVGKSMRSSLPLIILFAVVRLYPAAGFRSSQHGIRILLLGLRPDGTDLRPNGERCCRAISGDFLRIIFLQCVIQFWALRRHILPWLQKPLRAGGGGGFGVNGGADADCTAVNP